MVEALLSMFVLFLVLFGMLQIFYVFSGQLFTDYAALRGARSRAVGFADYLVKRELKVNAIGASGLLVTPALNSVGSSSSLSQYDASQFTMEKTLIQRYMVGATWLEYEYWYGRANNSSRKVSTTLSTRIQDNGLTTAVLAHFSRYLFPEQFTRKMFFKDGLDLKGRAELGNHSRVYLND